MVGVGTGRLMGAMNIPVMMVVIAARLWNFMMGEKCV